MPSIPAFLLYVGLGVVGAVGWLAVESKEVPRPWLWIRATLMGLVGGAVGVLLVAVVPGSASLVPPVFALAGLVGGITSDRIMERYRRRAEREPEGARGAEGVSP